MIKCADVLRCRYVRAASTGCPSSCSIQWNELMIMTNRAGVTEPHHQRDHLLVELRS